MLKIELPPIHEWAYTFFHAKRQNTHEKFVMSLMAGFALRQFKKENKRKIGDRGIFTTNPQRRKSTHMHSKDSDAAYLKFLKEEQDARHIRMKKSDRQRVAFIAVYCSLPVLLFLITYWWQSH